MREHLACKNDLRRSLIPKKSRRITSRLRLIVLAACGLLSLQCSGGDVPSCSAGRGGASSSCAARPMAGKGARPKDILSEVLDELFTRGVVGDSHRKRWEAEFRGGELERRLAASLEGIKLPYSSDVEHDSGEEVRIGRLCFVIAFFYETEDCAYNVVSDRNLAAFVDSCRKVYPTVSREAREVIDAAQRGGSLRKLLKDVWEPLAPTDIATCTRDWPVKTEKQLREELGDQDAEEYLRTGLRPLSEKAIKFADVKDAFAHGGGYRFNAMELLPGWMLNYTLPELRDLHSDMADIIPVNGGSAYHGWKPKCGEALYQLNKRFPAWGPHSEKLKLAVRAIIPYLLEKECEPWWNLTAVAGMWEGWTDELIPWDHVWEQNWTTIMKFRSYRDDKKVLEAMQINLRRLPRFAKHVNFPEHLGLTNETLMTHEFMWLGTAKGAWHMDKYDNVLMQITGEVDAYIVLPTCTALVANPATRLGLYDGLLNWSRQHLPSGPDQMKTPFFHLRLKPGEGVVLPSGTWHNVISRDTRRMGINAFFEPRYGKMQWGPDAWWNMWRRNDQRHLAVRSLWVETLKHLWDTKKISMAYHTSRMEII